jgi:predicted acetyltransferase
MTDVEVLRPEELRAAYELFAGTILVPPRDEDGWEPAEAGYIPERTLGVREAGALVATATSFPSRMAVPGGAVLPMAAVTRVGVRADRTRRGLLTAMMRRQLADVAALGEPLASLRASEARIYGRFGYGVATRGRAVRVRRGGGFRLDAPGGGRVRLVARAEIVPVLSAVYDRIALRRAGGMTRPVGWWTAMLRWRTGRSEHVLAAVHTGPEGDDGFVLASVGDGSGFARRGMRLSDLHAADTGAVAGLWRFLLGVDLTEGVEASLRPLDEPLELLLADPRDCAVTGQDDESWLRLVDVPAALAARAFPAGPVAVEPVLLAVHDPLLAANTGVYRLGGGTAERVGPLGGEVEPELECDVAGLAMAYLGDRAPSALAASGWWRVREPAALERADALFATSTSPWCGTFF